MSEDVPKSSINHEHYHEEPEMRNTAKFRSSFGAKLAGTVGLSEAASRQPGSAHQLEKEGPSVKARRLALAVGSSALIMLSLPTTALASTPAGSSNAAQGHPHGTATGSVRMSIDSKTNRLTLTPQPSTRTVYNAAGKVVSRRTVPAHGKTVTLQGYRANTAQGRRLLSQRAAPGTTAATDSSNCTPTGEGANSSNVVAYQPVTQTATSMFGASPVGDLTGQYITSAAEFKNARLTADNVYTTDTDACSQGAWKTNDGYWLTYSGIGLVDEVDNASTGLPMSALYQESPGLNSNSQVSSSVSLTASYGPISVGATLPASGGGTYTGISGAPQALINPASTDPWTTNMVDAWWEANAALPQPGTSDPVNDTDDAIWEWPSNTASFPNGTGPFFDSGYTYLCSNLVDCGS